MSEDLIPVAEMPPIAIGIPCNKYQQPPFWRSLWALRWNGGSLMSSSGALTDQNRNNIVMWFLFETDLPWLFFVDDDIELPPDALQRLYSAAVARDAWFMTGVYYRRSVPYDPLIFRQQEDGWYRSLLPGTDYTVGDIITVDASGLGCTLIKRDLFFALIESHFLCRRHNKSFMLLPFSQVHADERVHMEPGIYVGEDRAYLVQEVWPMKMGHLEPGAAIPFFALEYGRTEDLYFCELVRNANITMYAHTGVEVKHWGEVGFDRRAFESMQAYLQAQEQAHDE
ncbi:MAG: hypothetical protein NZP34_00335 [Caldilineales bacterium]|nr:hypothetical protein [Caldilineales bacterium]